MGYARTAGRLVGKTVIIMELINNVAQQHGALAVQNPRLLQLQQGGAGETPERVAMAIQGRKADVEKPDEWRIDLDPGPECDWATVQRVAHVAREVLDELGAVGWPKTSGGRGLHVYVRVAADHGLRLAGRRFTSFPVSRSRTVSVKRSPPSV